MYIHNDCKILRGSTELETSVAEQEIIPDATTVEINPTDGNYWTIGYKFKVFSLYNVQACSISINGGEYLYKPAGVGVNLSREIIVTSCKIKENGISFIWNGTM